VHSCENYICIDRDFQIDYASDILHELEACFKLIVPDPNTASCDYILFDSEPDVIDDFDEENS
jgi:hypothetical protein